VARLFREVIAEEVYVKQEPNERCWLRYVVFAILEDQNSFQHHNPHGNISGFERELDVDAMTMEEFENSLPRKGKRNKAKESMDSSALTKEETTQEQKEKVVSEKKGESS
jgi:hypothetical protein